SCYLGPGRRGTCSSRSAGASGHSISWLQRRWCHLLAACPIPSLCWREVDSNPRSRAKRTTARHCFLIPFVTTPVLPKGLVLPRPGDHSGRYAWRRSAVSVAVPEPFLFGTIV